MSRALACLLLALMLTTPLGARAGEGGDKKVKPPFLQLKTLAASTQRCGSARGVLTVEVGVYITDPKLRDLAELEQPVLRDAFVTVLQPYALGLPPGSPPSADYIALTLQRETDRVLGRRGAKLLIGSILIN